MPDPDEFPLQRESDDAGFLALPFDKAQFTDFLRGLLGAPQTIERRFRQSFALTTLHLKNLHEALLIRVDQQNVGQLVAFKATISFGDGSSVSLMTPESLFVYEETKPIESNGVTIVWTFLVQFPNKSIPEKQSVTFSAMGTTPTEGSLNWAFKRIEGHFVWDESTSISIRVEHTERTWGADIENLLANQVEQFTEQDSAWAIFWQGNSAKLIAFTGCLIFVGAITACLVAIGRFASSLKTAANDLQAASLEDRVDLTLDIIASGYWQQLTFACLVFLLIISILTIIASLFISDKFSYPNKGRFVLLTAFTQKRYEHFLQWRRRRIRHYFVASLSHLIVGLIGSTMFALFVQRLL